MTNDPNLTELSSFRDQLESLQTEMQSGFSRIHEEVQQAQLRRAERYAEYMRNWLAILTVTITVAFIGFGLLGITRYSDIEAYRKQMKIDADDVSEKAKRVSSEAQTVEHVMGDLQGRVKTLESKIDGIESRSQNVQNKTQQLEGEFKNASTIAQRQRIETSAFQANLVGALGPDLDIPIILKTPTFLGDLTVSTIEGQNFGDSRGHLYVLVGGTLARVEISPSSIQKWDKTSIAFVFSDSDYQALTKMRTQDGGAPQLSATVSTGSISFPSLLQPYLTFQVVTSDGKSSITSPSVPWPQPPRQSG